MGSLPQVLSPPLQIGCSESTYSWPSGDGAALSGYAWKAGGAMNSREVPVPTFLVFLLQDDLDRGATCCLGPQVVRDEAQ